MSGTSPNIAILWFRRDLRLSDNPALCAAAASGAEILPLFILEADAEDPLAPGAASRWWLHHSLDALRDALGNLGGRLLLRRGDPRDIVPALIAETGAGAVYWNRRYDPAAVARDRAVKSAILDAGAAAHSFNGALLREPWEVRTKTGGPYGVFTPFWKALCQLGDPVPPLAVPSDPRFHGAALSSATLEDLQLRPHGPNWAWHWDSIWTPGAAGAKDRLRRFLEADLAGYADARDAPAREGTSRLSPHLHFGELSPRQIWHWTLDHVRRGDGRGESAAWSFLRELGWRDFNHSLLFHNPDMARENHRAAFDRFPWRTGAQADRDFHAWTRGRTGYPLVDAGMRELWQTGFMHNRVRMVVASFLIKHLMIDWRRGEAWFRDTLVDADPANNVANWQWVAGSGADAAPFFRIFNPTAQGEKFDPAGQYTRRWVPELAALSDRYLYRPWELSRAERDAVGIEQGTGYPDPLIEHRFARQRALDAYNAIKGAA